MDGVLYQVPNTQELELSNLEKRQYWKELIYTGDFKKKTEKEEIKFSVDLPLIQHWHNTFSAMLSNGIEVPVPKGHTTDSDAKRGSVIATKVAKNKSNLDALFGLVEFKDDESAKLSKDSNVSIYVPPEFTDGKGKTYFRPIVHVAITDYPVIPGLGKFESIAASLTVATKEEKKKMDVKKLLAKLSIAEDTKEDEIELALEKAIDGLLAKVKPEEKKPEEKPVIAAGFVNLMKDNRKAKLQTLVSAGKITPAVSKELEKQFLSDSALSLALSADGTVSDNFENVLSALTLNGNVLPDKEKTGAQTLVLTHENVLDSKANPLLADMDRKAEEAKRNNPSMR